MLSDIVLCYTDAGIDFMKAHGFKRVFATGNTLDLDAVERESSKYNQTIKQSKTQTLLFCGVLRGKTRVDLLLHALAIIKNNPQLLTSAFDVHVIIIGAGDKFAEWQQLARDLGVSDMIEWTGELRGQDKLAPYFCRADLFVYPGRIGLSLIHAFAFGLPVVLNDNPSDHGPEYVTFKPRENGWAFKYGDAEDLAKKIAEALSKPSVMQQFGLAGKDFVFKNYSMSSMVERYSEALECAKNI